MNAPIGRADRGCGDVPMPTVFPENSHYIYRVDVLSLSMKTIVTGSKLTTLLISRYKEMIHCAMVIGKPA